MNVADLLQLQAALQTHGIVDAAAHKKHIVGIGLLGSKPLNALLILQNLVDLFGQSQQFVDIIAVFFLVNGAAVLGKLHRHAIHGGDLRTVGLGGCHRDLGPGQRVKHLVGLAGNAAAHHIHNGHGVQALFLGHAQRRQCVGRFARLAHHDHQRIFVQRHFAIAELRCQLYAHGDLCQILQHILCRHAHVPCRSAGHNVDLLVAPDLLVRKRHGRKVDGIVLDHRAQGILHRLGLLVDLLHHKMLKSGFFGGLGIPLDLGGLLFDLVAVQIVEMRFARGQLGKFQIADVIHIAGILQNGGHIRGHIGFAVGNANDHGAVLAGHPDLARIIAEHHFQRIRAAHTHHGFGNGVNGAQIILFIVIVHQLDQHLGVGLAVEGVAVFQQLGAQLGVVFNNAVVYAHHFRFHRARAGMRAVARNMGVCVHHAGLAMGGPAGMADAAGAL